MTNFTFKTFMDIESSGELCAEILYAVINSDFKNLMKFSKETLSVIFLRIKMCNDLLV